MRPGLVWLALGAFLLPLVARTLWFYRGVYSAPDFDLPRYQEMAPPAPPLSRQSAGQAGELISGKTVVIDWAHENQFEPPEIEALTQSIADRGGRLEVIVRSFESRALSLEQALRLADAYILIAPGTQFSASERAAVEQFVGKGGRMITISDPTRVRGGGSIFFDPGFGARLFTDVAILNTVLEPFDLVYSEDYLYNILENEGNFRHVLLDEFADDALTEGLRTVAFYAARSVQTRNGEPLILGDATTLSSLTDSGGGLAVAALSADGNVLALGDLTFLTDPYRQVADNGRLIANLASFALGGQRTFDLRDYPFVFGDRAVLLQTEAFGLKAETLRSVGTLQDSLRFFGTELVVASTAGDDLDRILPGLFSPDDELRKILEPFDLTLPEDSDDGTLGVPGLGDLRPAGTGLLLLSSEGGRMTLVLLAESEESLLALIDTLAQGELSGCIVQAHVAACSVGAGEGLNRGQPSLEDPFFEELPGENGFPLITPTPAAP